MSQSEKCVWSASRPVGLGVSPAWVRSMVGEPDRTIRWYRQVEHLFKTQSLAVLERSRYHVIYIDTDLHLGQMCLLPDTFFIMIGADSFVEQIKQIGSSTPFA